MILVAPDHIETGSGRLLRRRTAADQGAISGKYLFKSGDVVYSKIRPYLRKAFLATFDGLCSADMYPLTPADDVDSRFVLGVLLDDRFSQFAESVSVRSGIPKINRDELAEFTVLLPPHDEQVRIGLALSDIDALIDALGEFIEKKWDIKTGVMQRLLTGRQRLPGFDTAWEPRTFGDLADYEQPTPYLVGSSDYSAAGSIPVLTAGKTFVLGYTSERWGVYEKGPVIIFDDFTTGSRYVDFRFKVKSSAMKMLTARPGVADLRFVFERMQLIDFPLGEHKRRWISQYRHISVAVPELAEQEAIASVLADMDAEIIQLGRQLAKLKDVRRGTMQDLLSGRMRLERVGAAA
jgi:type I restriction enzyme S subunit